jgi:hypothetical protein
MSAIVAALRSLSQLILTCDVGLTKNDKQLLVQLGDILAPESDHLAYRQALQNNKSPAIAIPWLGAYTTSCPLLKTDILLPFSRIWDVPTLTAVHLRRLQTFYNHSSSTLIINQRPLINFTRCAKLLQRIDDIRQYYPAPPPPPPPPVDPQAGQTKDKSRSKTKTKDKDKDKDKRRSSGTAAPAPAALAWVKKELDYAPSVISLEHFEALVSELAQAERQSHERHEPQLRSLGFAAPAPPAPRQHHCSSSSGSPSSRLSPGGGRMSLESRLGKI